MIALAEVQHKKLKITDVKIQTVVSRPKQMYGWPGMCRAANGDILVAASERRQHTCPYGREIIVRSSDNGRTWSLPQEIYNSELDDRDANLLALPDGTVVLSWFTSTAFEKHWVERASRVSRKMRNDLLGIWMMKSYDNGLSWNEPPQRMPVGIHISPVFLSDGSLLSVGPKRSREDICVGVYKSKNEGASWKKISTIKNPVINGRTLLNENHILEIAPGRLLGMFRSDPMGDGFLYQIMSGDYGKSWTAPHKTGIWGYPPQLLRLENGVIMCSYSHRRTPYSIRAVFSYDEGRTWDTDNIVTLYEWEDEPDMGYPTSVELSPGKILTVFYCSRRDADYPGQTQRMDGNSPEGVLSVSFTLENY